ncbi:MAG: hypothetical protein ACQEP8_04385, partial [Chlamydiota bacterium]
KIEPLKKQLAKAHQKAQTQNSKWITFTSIHSTVKMTQSIYLTSISADPEQASEEHLNMMVKDDTGRVINLYKIRPYNLNTTLLELFKKTAELRNLQEQESEILTLQREIKDLERSY